MPTYVPLLTGRRLETSVSAMPRVSKALHVLSSAPFSFFFEAVRAVSQSRNSRLAVPTRRPVADLPSTTD